MVRQVGDDGVRRGAHGSSIACTLISTSGSTFLLSFTYISNVPCTERISASISTVSCADLGDLFDLDQEELVVVDEASDARALLALDQHLHGAVGQAEAAASPCRWCPTVKMSSGVGSLVLAFFCAARKISLSRFIASFERADRPLAAHEELRHHVRKHGDVAQRQERKRSPLGARSRTSFILEKHGFWSSTKPDGLEAGAYAAAASSDALPPSGRR